MARMIAGTLYDLVTAYANRYLVLSVDLSVAHTDEALGLREVLAAAGAPYASYMTIIAAPSAFAFKLNSKGMDAIDAAVGLEEKDFEITEIYVTNAAGAGTAQIEVEYRVD